MKYSELFLKSQKEFPKDEVASNAQLLIKGDFIEKLMAGVFSMLPLGLRVKDKIANIIREEMNALGANELLMPALHPRSVWDATGRWDDIDVMYKLKDNSGRELGLGTTHEEVITHIVKNNVDSYTDLPLALYQIQSKFRDEERPKSGLLRGREFTMKDLYSFHADEKSLDEFYDKVKEAYFKIFKRVGLGEWTHLTYASGGTFSKYSHEFQAIADIGEDTIFLCSKCAVAVNKEIIDKQSTCPECDNKELEEKTAIEVGNIFKLGTKFSEAAGLNFKKDDGTAKPVIMASYGIGVERVMGAIVETSHDNKGIIWPETVAPFQAHLLFVGELTKELKNSTDVIYNELVKNGAEVLYDDREGVGNGEKFFDADLIGIPWRLVVSEKTMKEKKVEIKKRNKKEARLVKIDEVIKQLKTS